MDEKVRTEASITKNRRRFTLFALLLPVWIFIGGFAMSQAHVLLSKAHPDVYLAELMIAQPEVKEDPDNIDVQTFLESGKSMDQLVEEASIVRSEFKTGSWILGGFLGLVIGLMVMNQFVMRKRTDYEPHKGDCFSCGRCMKYCPVTKES